MERVVRKFTSHEEAEEAEDEYYRNLTPEERLQVLLELNARYYPQSDAQTTERPARVCRITRRK